MVCLEYWSLVVWDLTAIKCSRIKVVEQTSHVFFIEHILECPPLSCFCPYCTRKCVSRTTSRSSVFAEKKIFPDWLESNWRTQIIFLWFILKVLRWWWDTNSLLGLIKSHWQKYFYERTVEDLNVYDPFLLFRFI